MGDLGLGLYGGNLAPPSVGWACKYVYIYIYVYIHTYVCVRAEFPPSKI